jgi:hypothetical protein
MVDGIRFSEFLIRATLNLARRIGSGRWPKQAAIVVRAEANDSFWGCIVVTVRYKYRNVDSRFEETHRQPFIFSNYAEAYLRSFPGGSEFPVRIDPKHPARSIPANWKVGFVRVK